jgi:hypothetical protein
MSEEQAELKEHSKHAKKNPALAPVSVIRAILAVLVAVVTLLGHAPTPKRLFYRQRPPISGRIIGQKIFGGMRMRSLLM